MKRILLIVYFTCSNFNSFGAVPKIKNNGSYAATCYSREGLTASGGHSRRHGVAADPNILPIDG